MRIKISQKNSKLGVMPNISLTPGLSCVKGIPCLIEGCYAMKAHRQYPNVRNAWDSNLKFYREAPAVFFHEWYNWMQKENPEKFRMFVGGDFPDEDFYKLSALLAMEQNSCDFLAFTKRYDFDYSECPENLTIILSTWPGVELPKNTTLRRSWLYDDPRRPADDEVFMCPGKCDSCGHECWGTEKDIVFKKH